MFPFPALITALMLIMVEPHFGTSATEKGLTFLMIPAEKLFTDIEMFMLVQFS
jgi:hypothetical protein